NYKNRRFEGMVNLPILDDRVDIRLAGEWTKRSGYTTNEITGDPVDGRDLWSTRLSLAWKPLSNLKTTLVWEHFSENDDRMRTSKQLCKTDPGQSEVDGVPLIRPQSTDGGVIFAFTVTSASVSQGCLPTSLYAPDAFEVPNGYALPYVIAGNVSGGLNGHIDPYASTTQSTDLRVIETQINPIYRSKNDTVELNTDYNITPLLTFTAQTGFNEDSLWSTEDYNRFNTSPGVFHQISTNSEYIASVVSPDGVFCDPQLGCSNRLVAQDISRERAWQLSQEVRLASSFSGPLNFSVGGNYMHYETVEDYYVFANTLTLFAASFGGATAARPSQLDIWVPGVSDNSNCLRYGHITGGEGGYQYHDPADGAGVPTEVCYSIDPAPLTSVDAEGPNYFLSRNPYALNSYAGFGEVYYNILDDLKLTGGLRWTDDQKHFTLIPSELLVEGYGYPSIGTVDQDWKKFTGRFAA